VKECETVGDAEPDAESDDVQGMVRVKEGMTEKVMVIVGLVDAVALTVAETVWVSVGDGDGEAERLLVSEGDTVQDDDVDNVDVTVQEVVRVKEGVTE
jgi:hypothetical protein